MEKADSSSLSELARRGDLDALAARMTDLERSRRFHRGELDFRLDAMRELWESLGRPLAGRPVVHVAGSKGKGSVCSILAALAGAHGRTRGLYLSPHVDRWSERVQIDGQQVPETVFGAALADLLERPEGRAVSFFELLTAGAYVLMERKAVDLAVVETGIGGRLDATNVLPTTLAVITSIELEHSAVLGSSLSEIAREKAGIVKPGQLAVSGLSPGPAADVLSELCRDRSAELLAIGEDWGWEESGDELEWWRGARRSVLPRPDLGPFAARNAALALTAFERVCDREGWEFREEAARAALQGLSVPGRCEPIARDPLVLRDGAHTPEGVVATCRWLRDRVGAPPVLVLGLAEDKRHRELVEALPLLIGPLVATTVPGGRSRDPAEIAELARAQGIEAEVVPDPDAALARARVLAGRDGSILVTGSFWLIGALERAAGGEG